MKGFCSAAREKVEEAEDKVHAYCLQLLFRNHLQLLIYFKVHETSKMNRQLLVALKRSKEKEKRLEQKKSRIEDELAQLANQLKDSQETLLLLQQKVQEKTEEALAKEKVEVEKDEVVKATFHQDIPPVKAAGLFLSAIGLVGLGLWCLKKC